MLKSFRRKRMEEKEYVRNKAMFEQFQEYVRMGTFLPSLHIVKQNNIHAYRERFGTKILVETGTYLGDMVEAQKMHFDRVYSIELSPDLYLKATDRFKNDKNVKILQGDSGIVIKDILTELNGPALFWLDGHYSGGPTAKGEKDTPVLLEVEQILNENDEHVILIDDARLFTGDDDYPKIPELCQFVLGLNPDKEIVIADDIIRITSKL